jgi:hypothetical protein
LEVVISSELNIFIKIKTKSFQLEQAVRTFLVGIRFNGSIGKKKKKK